MTFQSPYLLLGLLLAPLALGLYLWAQHRRARFAVRFTNLDLLASVVATSPGWRRHAPPALYLLALLALGFALARPQATIMVPREDASVVLLMDVSRSMEATDVEPSRLVAAQDSATRFLDQVPDRLRVGLVAFSTGVREVMPPTSDHRAVKSAIASLRPEAGTAMGDGLARALVSGAEAVAGGGALEPGQLAVVLLSDGASTSGRLEPDEAAAEARRMGVPVYTIALGTAAGRVIVPGMGRLQSVNVPPDPETLQDIAETTGGRFFAAPTESDLRAVYQDLSRRVGFVPEEQEVTAFFAGAALLFTALGGTMAAFWFNRFP